MFPNILFPGRSSLRVLPCSERFHTAFRRPSSSRCCPLASDAITTGATSWQCYAACRYFGVCLCCIRRRMSPRLILLYHCARCEAAMCPLHGESFKQLHSCSTQTRSQGCNVHVRGRRHLRHPFKTLFTQQDAVQHRHINGTVYYSASDAHASC